MKQDLKGSTSQSGAGAAKGYVHRHRVTTYRGYRYAFGAAEPILSGNAAMQYGSFGSVPESAVEEYAKDQILLVRDGAGWHKSRGLTVPDNGY